MPEKKTSSTNNTGKRSSEKEKTSVQTKTASETKKTVSAKTTSTVKKTEPAKTTTKSKEATTSAKTASTVKKTEPAKTTTKSKEATASTKAASEVKKSESVKSASESKKVESTMKQEPKKSKSSSEKEKRTISVQMISIFSLVGAALLAGLLIVIILSVQSCSQSNEEYQNQYKTSTKVEYEAEILGTVKRNIPEETKNEGMSSVGYPTYGSTLRDSIGTSEDKVAIRNALIRESEYLTTVNTWNGAQGKAFKTYNRMDSKGNLYLNDDPYLDADGNQRTLYKHTASEGLYLGNVSDDEKAVIKQIHMSPRGYDRGYGVTGVYAPAGEVVKVELSAEDMEATGGIVVHIGQALFNGKANNIWAAKNAMNRFPVIMNTMVISKELSEYDEERGVYTAYIGSFVGGPVYIRNERVPFTVTISGAVTYSHFILGYTTEEEFEENKKSSAPYFDLEVWEYGVLHSGPKRYAEAFSYEEIYDAGILWEKISLVSTQVNRQGIVFLYDPFVAAGAAVAFPGQGSVNCPMGWMSGSLNYKSFVNGGAWGNMHEYNHNFQGFGLGNGGEVTNNSLNLVSYSLFTRISANREIGTVNEGLSGWNRYTSATWALQEITENRYSNGKYGLAIYANMLHNFGQEIYINSAKTSGGQSVDKWFLATMNASKHDMTYYYKDLIGYDVSEAVLSEAKTKNYPMFVPVSSIYQTGRSFNYEGEKKYIETMQPYVIPYGEDYLIDLNQYVFESNIYQGGSIVIPDGFSYKIKNITQPENGAITDQGENIFKFTPNENNRSGKIYVTLEITKDDGAFKVDDVDLVLEFEQSHEMNKTMLERTTYTYSADKMYSSATEAFEAGYANYSDKKEGDNQNPILNGKVVQNGNAEVWFTEAEQMQDNQIVEVTGKMYIDETGKYRIALRGRYDCALYVSLDNGKTYELAATYKQTTTSSPNFAADVNKIITDPSIEKPSYYQDYEMSADSWLYFKAVLVVRNTKPFSFIGVGWGKFTPEAPILDADGNEIGTIPESVQVSYANAYRPDYEFNHTKFETDYFYKREYTYNYANNITFTEPATIVTSANYSPWDKENHKLENLVDGDKSTYIHTNYTASETKPLVIAVDLGKEITANQMTMFTQPRADYHCPTTFLLEGSLDGQNYFKIGSFSDMKVANYSVVANFEETTFRYYRINITKSSNRYVILSEIQFANIFEVPNGVHISLDSEGVTLKGKWNSESMMSSFGHSFTGKKNSTIEYEFEGTRFGILSSNKLGHGFEVYIDGKKIDSIDLREDTNRILMSYLSPELDQGTHKVKIVCTGTANVDSLVYWK
ncbi:MAG: M60 family metallopeptidase [Anaeroplasmataceae bacterium]|nr:M60 family metallopeptidase [Anaeroplasmataceae bacterium]